MDLLLLGRSGRYTGDSIGVLMILGNRGATAAVEDGAADRSICVTQRPLYGVLVIGELPHEPDPRTITARQQQAAPAPSESLLKRTLSRWTRKLHAAPERSG